MIRVHLVMGANLARGKDAPDFAATHIYTVPSQMMPVVVQRGIGGQFGAPGGGQPFTPPPNTGNQPINGTQPVGRQY